MNYPGEAFAACSVSQPAYPFTVMFTLISYLWILFMLVILITPIVIGVIHKPKKAKSAATEPGLEGMGGALEEQQVLDFGDELAQMDSK